MSEESFAVAVRARFEGLASWDALEPRAQDELLGAVLDVIAHPPARTLDDGETLTAPQTRPPLDLSDLPSEWKEWRA